MKITVANKPVKGDKPRTKLERDIYFKNLQFNSETISPEDFESIVGNGYPILIKTTHSIGKVITPKKTM